MLVVHCLIYNSWFFSACTTVDNACGRRVRAVFGRGADSAGANLPGRLCWLSAVEGGTVRPMLTPSHAGMVESRPDLAAERTVLGSRTAGPVR